MEDIGTDNRWALQQAYNPGVHIHAAIYGRQGHWFCGECDELVPFGYTSREQREQESREPQPRGQCSRHIS